MKKVIMALIIVAVLVPLMAATVCAQTNIYDYFTLIKLSATIQLGADSDYVYALFPSTNVAVSYDGSASLATGTAPGVSLTGVSTQGSATTNIWRYYYTTSASPTLNSTTIGSDWTMFGSLVGPLSTPSPASGYGSATAVPLGDITGIALGYNVNLSGPAPALADGVADMNAAAVPEPGTILAAFAILGPAGFVFRRRRA